MTTKKLSIYLFTIGAGFKLILIILFRLFPHYIVKTIIPSLLVHYDPSALVADWITQIIFHRNEMGVAPSTEETIFFEIILVVVFGLQCVLVGLLFFKVWNYLKRKHCSKNKA